MEKEFQENNYSILMSVYAKENPAYFDEALSSLLHQTILTDDFVLVCDGPLTEELDAIIKKYDEQYPGIFNVVRLEKNGGVGRAVMIGLPRCKNELIMRADSDDISLPHRAEIEIKILEEGGYDVCSSTVSTFTVSPDKIEGERKLPSTHEEIVKFAKLRSPFNQPSAIFRKSKALEVGGYQPYRFGEDYDLWVRMLIGGAKGFNIEESLVLMRMDSNTYKGRKNKEAYRCRIKTGKYMRKQKFISLFAYWKFRLVYWFQYVTPPALNEWVYKRVLQKKSKNK